MSGVHVSVIVPCYKVGFLLERAVGSVLRQCTASGEPRIEVVVVDDANEDDQTLASLQRVKALGPEVLIVRHERNQGVSAARNSGIRAARGEYIAFLDGDDYYLEDGLVTRLTAIARWPAARLVGGESLREDDRGVRQSLPMYESRPKFKELFAHSYSSGEPIFIENPLLLLLEVGVFLHTNTVMLHRSLVHEVGYFDETLTHGEDDHYWLRAAARSPLVFTPRPVAVYVSRAGSAVSTRDVNPSAARMIRSLLGRPEFRQYQKLLMRKYIQYLAWDVDRCLATGTRVRAVALSMRWICACPRRREAWRALLQCVRGPRAPRE